MLYTGTGGTLRNVVVTHNPPGCDLPTIEIIMGSEIHFTWPKACVGQCEVVEYEFTVDYPCCSVQPPYSVDWTYPGAPTLTEWSLVLFILAVAGFFGYMLLRRRRAVVSVR